MKPFISLDADELCDRLDVLARTPSHANAADYLVKCSEPAIENARAANQESVVGEPVVASMRY